MRTSILRHMRGCFPTLHEVKGIRRNLGSSHDYYTKVAELAPVETKAAALAGACAFYTPWICRYGVRRLIIGEGAGGGVVLIYKQTSSRCLPV
jgi:hypothetical protein